MNRRTYRRCEETGRQTGGQIGRVIITLANRQTDGQTNSVILIYPQTVSPRQEFMVCVHCDIDLGDMTLGQGHDTLLYHGVRSYEPDTDFGYLCTVTLTLEI